MPLIFLIGLVVAALVLIGLVGFLLARYRVLGLIFLLLFAANGVAQVPSALSNEDHRNERAHNSAKPPEAIQNIIQWIEKREGHFDPAFLPTVKGPAEFRKGMKKDFLSYTIHPPEGSMDMFTDTIYYDPLSKQFWVSRTGGIAGVDILYGPGKMEGKAQEQQTGTLHR